MKGILEEVDVFISEMAKVRDEVFRKEGRK